MCAYPSAVSNCTRAMPRWRVAITLTLPRCVEVTDSLVTEVLTNSDLLTLTYSSSQVRRMLAHCGLPVLNLKRLAYGACTLGGRPQHVDTRDCHVQVLHGMHVCPSGIHTDNRSQLHFTTATGCSPVRRGARRPRSDAGRASCSRRRPALIGAGQRCNPR